MSLFRKLSNSLGFSSSYPINAVHMSEFLPREGALRSSRNSQNSQNSDDAYYDVDSNGPHVEIAPYLNQMDLMMRNVIIPRVLSKIRFNKDYSEPWKMHTLPEFMKPIVMSLFCLRLEEMLGSLDFLVSPMTGGIHIWIPKADVATANRLSLYRRATLYGCQ